MAKIKGAWTLNETVDVLSTNIPWENVNIACSGGIAFQSISIDTAQETLYYAYEINGSDIMNVYSQSSGWGTVTDFRYIDFGETEQTISNELAKWLKANGTSNGGTITIEEKTESGIVIKYGDEILATLKSGQTATLHCADKLMKADVIISAEYNTGEYPEYPEYDGSIDVDGSGSDDNSSMLGTWKWLTLPNILDNETYTANIKFESNGESYDTMGVYDDSGSAYLYYGDKAVYQAYWSEDNEVYKTFTITEEPTDETIIEYIKANATKQNTSGGELGTFTLDNGTSYNFEIGMTWAEFIESDYNTNDHFYTDGNSEYVQWHSGNASMPYIALVISESPGHGDYVIPNHAVHSGKYTCP